MADERVTAVLKAKLAKKANRYDDVLEEMKSVALMDVELTAGEKVLLITGFVYAVAYRRECCRKLSSVAEKEESEGRQVNSERVRKYIGNVQAEINQICADVASILDRHLIPSCSSAEDFAIYYKLIGDSYQYRASDDRSKDVDQSLIAYQTAYTCAEIGLSATHPLRVRLALDLQLLNNNILDFPESAKKALEKATSEIAKLDETNTELQRDSLTFLMGLIKNQRKLMGFLNAEEENAAKNDADESAGPSNSDMMEVQGDEDEVAGDDVKDEHTADLHESPAGILFQTGRH